MRRCAALLLAHAGLLTALLWRAGAGGERLVHSCGELAAALNDTDVSRVLVAPREDGYNCSAEDFPPQAGLVLGREVTLEGQGPTPVRIDYNWVQEQITVGNGGSVRVVNIWKDDCLMPEIPFICSYQFGPDSRIDYENAQISDATCVDVRRSRPIQYFIANSSLAFELLDSRTVLFKDTGWVDIGGGSAHKVAPVAAVFRMRNTTLTCTGNLTHPLPPDFQYVEVEGLSPGQRNLLLAIGLALLVLLVSSAVAYSRSQSRDSPEFLIAGSKGFELEALLGAGHYGLVYRARNKATGQPVAVKVVDLLPSQRRQLASAWRECQLLSQLQHDCIVHVHTFYAAEVHRKKSVVETRPGNQYIELGFNATNLASASLSEAPVFPGRRRRKAVGSGGSSGEARLAGSLPGGQPYPELSQGHVTSGESSGSAFGSGSGGSGGSNWTASDGEEGLVLIQVQLVMQFCDMGTLEAAIKAGAFQDPDTGLPVMRHILLTSLEMAQGLAYLHHRDRRLVHRDMSAANVLLTRNGDERGFRALLSDFGLSTCLAEDQTHRTSEIKGTISYMSPEVFLHDDISPALDIYSLGIILHMMFSGSDPYSGMASAGIVLSKVRARDHPEESRLPALRRCPPAYQQLVWDATVHDRRKRPTAAELVSRLEEMLAESS